MVCGPINGSPVEISVSIVHAPLAVVLPSTVHFLNGNQGIKSIKSDQLSNITGGWEAAGTAGPLSTKEESTPRSSANPQILPAQVLVV
jgi:hypothetical protein